MRFVSYAQNFEDVMLWRALKDVQFGFYIDIGAQHPIADSVSYAFYNRGWLGVSVEPSPEYCVLFESLRPNEIVEQLVIGTDEGHKSLYKFAGTGLSTVKFDIAQRYTERGLSYTVEPITCVSLSSLLSKYSRHEIHWLKIDVEGAESDVIESWGTSLIRPWILVVESTIPGTSIESFTDWEPRILQRGYLFAYFDGLNRFYIHSSRSELLKSFADPPNVFDQFSLSYDSSNTFLDVVKEDYRSLQLDLENANRDLKIVQTQNNWFVSSNAKLLGALAERQKTTDNLDKEIAWLRRHSFSVEKDLMLVRSSISWRITYPVRSILAFFINLKTLTTKILFSFVARVIIGLRRPLGSVINFVLKFPKLSFQLNELIKNFPFLHQKLTEVVLPVAYAERSGIKYHSYKNLTPRARMIGAKLAKLKQHANSN